MKILVCKPNLVSFLTAIYASYYTLKDAELITSDACLCTMLDECIEIGEDEKTAVKVRNGIISKGGKLFWDEVSDAYRSGNKDKENIITAYLKLFFKHGVKVREMFDSPVVIAFNDTFRKVWHEIHRLHGFIRFKELSDGLFYGYYSSDNDVLERLTPHFVPRFNSQRFVLHDYKRGKMAYFDGVSVDFIAAPETVTVELSEAETVFQELWKQYHKNVSIKERENLRLQRQWLPKKYRHFMNEF